MTGRGCERNETFRAPACDSLPGSAPSNITTALKCLWNVRGTEIITLICGPSYLECTQHGGSGGKYTTDVRSLFIFSDQPNVSNVCLNWLDWQNLRTPLMWLVWARECVTGPKSLRMAVFLYIVSQRIQAVSTWADHFGPNDMAWQQNNPKGTWGSFLEPGPNYNTGQKNQTTPHLIGFFSFMVLYMVIQSWDGGKQNPCSLLDPKHSPNCHCMVSSICRWNILKERNRKLHTALSDKHTMIHQGEERHYFYTLVLQAFYLKRLLQHCIDISVTQSANNVILAKRVRKCFHVSSTTSLMQSASRYSFHLLFWIERALWVPQQQMQRDDPAETTPVNRSFQSCSVSRSSEMSGFSGLFWFGVCFMRLLSGLWPSTHTHTHMWHL